MKFLIVVAGPTAVGKTALSIKLAKHFQTEIISADSRQAFREMEKATAKPDSAELTAVKHYFINSHSIYEEFNAALFEKEALTLLEKLYEKTNVVIVTGGSGLYIDALCNGFDEMPEIVPQVREEMNELYQQNGLEYLQKKLQETDPLYFDKVDLNNPQRIIRALEVSLSTGKPYSSYRSRLRVERPFKIIKTALQMPREELYKRIDERMDKMIAGGLFDEAEKLFPLRHLNALQTVGYSEIFDFIEGAYDKEEAIRLLKRNSRRYAKRQITWFKRDANIRWFESSDFKGILKYIEHEMQEQAN